MKRLQFAALLIVVSAGCSAEQMPVASTSLTETVAATPTASSTQPSSSTGYTIPLPPPITQWGPNDTLSVGSKTRGGLLSYVRPGRYRAQVFGGAPVGSLTRCSDEICSADSRYAIATQSFRDGGATIIEIEPTDVAIALVDLVITRVD